MVLQILYSFLMSFLPMATSNWMQMSQFLSATYAASGPFPHNNWTPWFEQQGFKGFPFEKHKSLCNLENKSGIWKLYFPSSFASLRSSFEVFLPFLKKAWSGTSLLQGHVRAARLHHNRDKHECGSKTSWGAALVFGCPSPILGLFFTNKSKY